MQKSHRSLFRYDPLIGYRFISNQYKRYQLDREYVIQTNSLGFRSNQEYSPKKKDDRFRIIAVGDSYLAGDGISNNKRFGDILECETNIEFINLGLPGSGNDQQLLILENIVKDWEFDALLIAPYLHDIQRNLVDYSWVVQNYDPTSQGYFNCIQKPYFTHLDGKLILWNQPSGKESKVIPNLGIQKAPSYGFFERLKKGFPKFFNFIERAGFVGWLYDFSRIIKYRYLKKQSDQSYNDNESGWLLMKSLLERMIAVANGKKVFIVPFPHFNHVVFREMPFYLNRFKELERSNVHVIDILPIFRGDSLSTLKKYYNKFDGHFNENANSKISNLLKTQLKKYSDQILLSEAPAIVSQARTDDKYILGISCYYHDSASAIIKNGEIIAAAQEERFTRIKHDKSFPLNAINYCLEEARIPITQLETIVYYDNPLISLERALVNFLVSEKTSQVELEKLASWSETKLSLKQDLRNILNYEGSVVSAQHHRSHAASAFFPSPFKSAAILVVDGVGEWACSSIGIGRDDKVTIIKEHLYPHSLGLLYSTITAFCGFKVNSGEYKLMGLAPYGVPIFKERIYSDLMKVNDDGSFKLNLNYFAFISGNGMFSDKMTELFGVPPRDPESKITQAYMDIGRSLQEVLEEIILMMVRYVKQITQEDYLVLAGGVALNCVANGKILRSKIFKDIWIQPASGDAGGALGAALDYHYEHFHNGVRKPNSVDKQVGYLYGPRYSSAEIEAYLEWIGASYKRSAHLKYSEIADYLSDGKVVGFFSDRMEFGPRALGARSIIADPRNVEMQSKLNLKIKFRESFRPFAPIVLEDDVSQYFDLDRPSPYMLIVADVLQSRRLHIPESINETEDLLKRVNVPKSDIPSVTHIDYSARIQTLTELQNPELFKVITEFKKKTGYGVLVNTSFNVRSEPIVCTPEDAYKCFMRTGMDILVLEDYILDKANQPEFKESERWQSNYELD
jgi:carbamoyltransferase